MTRCRWLWSAVQALQAQGLLQRVHGQTKRSEPRRGKTKRLSRRKCLKCETTFLNVLDRLQLHACPRPEGVA